MVKDISIDVLAAKILFIRGKRVMLDSELVKPYDVPTKVLLQSVKRNKQRFPDDFMFVLTIDEFRNLRSQIVTSKKGGRRYLPYAFTEQGVAMLSSVLNSDRAICANIAIMRAFVKLRELLLTHKELAEKIIQLESEVDEHDEKIPEIFEAIKQLLTRPSQPEKPQIGFN